MFCDANLPSIITAVDREQSHPNGAGSLLKSTSGLSETMMDSGEITNDDICGANTPFLEQGIPKVRTSAAPKLGFCANSESHAREETGPKNETEKGSSAI